MTFRFGISDRSVQDDFGFENPIHPECPITLDALRIGNRGLVREGAAAQWSQRWANPPRYQPDCVITDELLALNTCRGCDLF